MTTTYTNFSQQTASEKVTLVHLNMKREVKIFNAPGGGGSVYNRTEDFFVVGVQVDGTVYTAGTTANPSSNEFFFDSITNTLYLNSDSAPEGREIIITNRLFIADFPVIASADLTLTGPDVQYLGLLTRAPGFSTALNFASSNKTIVGSGSLDLDNSTGFFNEILQTYRLENKEFSAYSWSPSIPINEHKTIYRGITNRANINENSLRLSVKDSLFSLNSRISLPKFSSSEVIERDINRFKKSIFGRCNGMGIQSTNQNGTGFTGTGELTSSTGDSFIEAVGGSFLGELAPRDVITAAGISATVRKVVDDNYILVTEPLTGSLAGAFTVAPMRQFNNRNRTFSIANHALKKFSTTITAFVDTRRIRVLDGSGFAAGDTVIVLNEAYVIDRISKAYTDSPTNSVTQDVLVLARTLSGNNFPSIGATVETKEVFNVMLGDDTFLDVSVAVNNADNTETTITLASDTEQVVATDGFLENTLTSVLNTPYYVLGIPAIHTLTLSGTLTNFRGTYFQLANVEDTTTLSGPTVALTTSGTIQELTEAVAETINFAAGTLYQVTDGVDADDYFLVRTAGVDMDHQNIGSELPIRVILTDAQAQSYELTSIEIRRVLANSRIEQLFAFDTVENDSIGWTFVSNIGTVGLVNSLVLATATGITITTNDFTNGVAPNIMESIAESVSSRDLIKIQTETTFQFVVEAQSSYVEINGVNAATISGIGLFRNPNYITDASLITCSVFGQTLEGTVNGTFIKTAADASRKLLVDAGLTNFVNTSTFTAASINEPLTIGIYAPYNLSGQPPTILDLLNRVTLSTLGSVGLDENFMFKFQLLNGFKPETLDNIRVITNSNITGRASAVLTPSPLFRYTLTNIDAAYDFGENTPSSKLIRLENAKIRRLTDLDTTEDVSIYLRDLTEATGIADRFLNYSQRFNRIVSFSGSLALSNVDIGDIVLLDILELRNQSDANIPFLGMVTEFQRDGDTVVMSVDDFGGLFLRSANLASNSATTFATSDSNAKLLGTFLTDDNGIIDNDETTLGFNVLP